MFDSATSELIKAIPIADELDILRVSFNSMCRSVDRLELKQLQLLAYAFFDALIFVLPAASPWRDSLDALASSIISSDSALGDRVKPLLRAALADDLDDRFIWDLVFRAAADVEASTTSQSSTPPCQTPPRTTSAYDSTPFTHSSASQQGNEQTRKLLEDRIFEEIQACTYREVEGFFEKYFEGKDWTGRAQDVFESIKTQYVNDEWIDLGGSPDQTRLLKWLFSLQDDLLSKEKRRYCTVELSKELTGGNTRRQIDLLIKRKSGESSDTEHNCKDIMVIGELKASHNDGVKKPLVQLALYAQDLFACQPTRRYLHAFTICGSKMEAWVFDRSGCYSPGPFDIHEHPERFIQVLAGYIMMSEDELGLDTFIQQDGDSHFINVKGDEGRLKRLQLYPEPFTRQRAIVSRATSCYLTKHPDSDDYSYVAKFSWPSSKRKPETDFLELANQRGVEGIARLVGHYDITSINDMRSGMTFAKRYSFNGTANAVSSFSQKLSQSQCPVNKHIHSIAESSAKRPKKRKLVDENPKPKRSKSNSQRSGLPSEVTYLVRDSREASPVTPSDDLYEDRIFRCLVIFPKGRAIYKYQSPVELLEALRDAVKAHQSLYSKGNILHRDISENNIIIADLKKTGSSGMLIDLDLAKELGSGRSGARCRAGTMEFMAIQVLRDTDHTYRHDLESFFYVLLWQCIRRGWEFVGRQNPKHPSQLTGWYTGTYDEIARNKQGNMDRYAFEFILKEFPEEFDCIKPLCRELRSILFPIREDALFTGTPPDPNGLYGPIVDVFDKTIDRMRT